MIMASRRSLQRVIAANSAQGDELWMRMGCGLVVEMRPFTSDQSNIRASDLDSRLCQR
jgi:hypothetical protein